MLPKSILDASQNILSVLGSVIVAAVVNPYFLLPVVILLILFILIRKVYLKTSKNLKRLEGIGEKIWWIAIINVYYDQSLRYSKITCIHSFGCHFEWLVNGPRFQKWEHFKKRVRQSSRLTYSLLVHERIDYVFVWLISGHNLHHFHCVHNLLLYADWTGCVWWKNWISCVASD